MRVDVISVFPDYLAPLDLALVGKARKSGLLDVRVHDLRGWTQDRHRTVDDTAYGGGPGMVMKPEPWGRALDDVVPLQAPEAGHGELACHPPLLLVPTPSGRPFTQTVAEELAPRPWLVFACGRYEGIDERVVDHARQRMPVLEVSIGDYVVNGGEVAALVVIEAVARLLPGFLGNPESLRDESHAVTGAGRLLEYPVYTRPPTWRGLPVPEVLLGGDHGRIARWRREQAVRRTAERRPDLLHPAQLVTLADSADAAVLRPAELADMPELWTLQRACWLQEAQANRNLDIPPLTETLQDVRESLGQWQTYVVRAGGRLVGSVRGRGRGDRWEIGRIMVAPDLQGRGLGRRLLDFAESLAPEPARAFRLCTGAASWDNLRMYRKAGYQEVPAESPDRGVVWLVKPRR